MYYNIHKIRIDQIIIFKSVFLSQFQMTYYLSQRLTFAPYGAQHL